MSGIGDFAATLSVSSTDWRNGFAEANSVLDRFGAHFESTVASVIQQSSAIGVAARTAAISIGSLGIGLKTVGGSGSGLLKIAGTLSGIGWTVGNLNTALKNLRSGTTFTQKIVGSLGAVGAAAGIANLALHGVSMTMARMGKDTASIDRIAVSVGRVATAATVAVIGIKTISFSLNTMRSIASTAIGATTAGFRGLQTTILAVPSTIGAVASAMRRMGSAGMGMARSTGAAVGQFAASAGDSIGQLGQGLAQVSMGFAMGGIIGGLATTIGMLVSAGFSMEKLGAVSQTASKIIEDLSTRGQRYFQSFLEAIQPLTDAIQNVWLPAVVSSTDQAGNAFSRFFNFVETSWGGWIYDSINSLAELVGNIDIYFQIAQQSIVLWASNAILQVGDFVTNAGQWLSWFGENWGDVLTSAGKLAQTVFTNIATNIGDVFSKIWEWVKSGFQGNLEIDWKPLTDGFKSTIQEWPKLTKTELETMTPELEQLYEQLGRRQREAMQRGNPLGAVGDLTKQPQASQPARSGRLDNRAALTGSSEAASILLRGVNGNKKDDVEQKQLTALQQLVAISKGNKPQTLQPLTI